MKPHGKDKDNGKGNASVNESKPANAPPSNAEPVSVIYLFI